MSDKSLTTIPIGSGNSYLHILKKDQKVILTIHCKDDRYQDELFDYLNSQAEKGYISLENWGQP